MQRFWLIRRQPYRETSVLVTVLTEQDQLLRAVIRGGHGRSEFELCEGAFSGTGLTRIQQVAPLAARLPLSGIQLISGLYANEILYYLIPDGAVCPGLFDAYTGCITDCARDLQAIALRTLERHLLRDLGHYLYPSDVSHETVQQDRYYRVTEDGRLVEVEACEPDAALGEWWQMLMDGQWSEHTHAFAMRVHRSLLDRALGGRRLVSRELLIEWKKTTYDS